VQGAREGIAEAATENETREKGRKGGFSGFGVGWDGPRDERLGHGDVFSFPGDAGRGDDGASVLIIMLMITMMKTIARGTIHRFLSMIR